MKKLIYLFVLVMLISGCASSSVMPWGIDKVRNNLMNIEIGMSKEQIKEVMGNPYNREAYSVADGSVLEFWIYLTKYTYAGDIPDSDTTPICFIDGKVNGWGRNFYQQQKQRYEIEVKHSSGQ